MQRILEWRRSSDARPFELRRVVGWGEAGHLRSLLVEKLPCPAASSRASSTARCGASKPTEACLCGQRGGAVLEG